MRISSPFEQYVTFIYVTDLDRSAHFYGDILQLPLALDQGTCRIFGVSQTAFVGLCTAQSEIRPTGVILTLVASDLDDWHRRLLDAEVKVEKPPTFNETYNITHLFARDPDGYLVEIQRFHDPNWPAPTPPEQGSR